MASIKLREDVVVTATTKFVVKRGLHARTCDSCGKVYDLPRAEQSLTRDLVTGRVSFVFDQPYCEVVDGSMRKMGNTLLLDCCSPSCGAKLAEGDWRLVGDGKKFDKNGCRVTAAKIFVPRVVGVDELLLEWEGQSTLAIPEVVHVVGSVTGNVMGVVLGPDGFTGEG